MLFKKTGFVTKVYYSIDSNMDFDMMYILYIQWQPYGRVYRVFHQYENDNSKRI